MSPSDPCPKCWHYICQCGETIEQRAAKERAKQVKVAAKRIKAERKGGKR